MGGRRIQQFLGLGLLALAVIAVIIWRILFPPDITEHVKGVIGGSKVGLMADERINKILHDRYRLTVEIKSGSTGEMLNADPATNDFIWPTNQWALEQWQDAKKPVAKSSKLLNTPLVFYSWDQVTDGLVKAGLVEEVPLRSLAVDRDGVAYFVKDQAGLAEDILGGKTWKDIGLPNLFGKMAVTPTDLCQSTSGQMFGALLATTRLGRGEPPSPDDMQRLTPELVAYYKRLGILQPSSAPMFQQFLVMGVGTYPIMVDYESLMVEFYLQHPTYQDLLRKRIRIIYPRPTAWAEHIFIATNSRGAKLLDALQDKEIQDIAWAEHGFRTGLADTNKPEVLQISGIPATIESATPLPAWKAMPQFIDAYCKTP
jgi:hypothetical protein